MYPKSGAVCLKDMLEELKRVRREHGRYDHDALRSIVPRSHPVIILWAGNEFGNLVKGTEKENAVSNGITENADLFGEVIDVLRDFESVIVGVSSHAELYRMNPSFERILQLARYSFDLAVLPTYDVGGIGPRVARVEASRRR
jgi:hypothetical protein